MTELEQQIVNEINKSLGDAILKCLTGYSTPLDPLIKKVVASRSEAINALLEESIDSALKGDFRTALKDACAHKLARVLVSKMEGEIEQKAGELRQSPEFRSKVTLAISDVIRQMKP